MSTILELIRERRLALEAEQKAMLPAATDHSGSHRGI